MKKQQKLEIKKFRKENKKQKIEKSNYKWVFNITIVTFLITLLFSFISEVTIPNVNVIIGIIIVILFIFLGILFDIIGLAVATSTIKSFHSMNAKKVKGADVAIILIKNAPKVSSFCNDVVGDICGIISGSASAIIALILSNQLKIDMFVISLITTSLIASLTIGGKALGKAIAINKSNIIVYEFSKFLSYFYKVKK